MLISALQLVLWVFTLFYVFVEAQDPIVNLRQGRIVGIKTYTKNSVTPVAIYLGIPYAVPPIGRYRFSAPEKHPGWSRTLYAHRMPPRCPQMEDGISDNYSEDCLYLNVWTIRHTDAKPIPVVVILYSETWSEGGINLPCQELAAEGFIVVTVAFRLNLLSFFTLGTPEARGNLALLDQYLALLWIRENINSFGGDPNAITVFGFSAGADSILYHIVSPRAKGLFQRAIIMSPQYIWTALDNVHDNENETEKLSREAAASLGCDFKSDIEILSCMRSRPIADIIALSMNSTIKKGIKPSPDNFLPASEQYLPNSIATAISSSPKQLVMQLDLLLGTTDLESVNYNRELFVELLNKNTSFLTSYLEHQAIPEVLKLFSLGQPNNLAMILQTIRWEFRKSTSHRPERKIHDALEAIFRMESSAKWAAGSALLAARLARLVTGLFVYRYTYPVQIDLYGRILNFTGAAHGADLISVLGDALLLQVARRPTSPEDRAISTHFRNYLVNFIQFGAPATEDIWPRYRVGDAYMHDVPDQGVTKCHVHRISSEVAFWLQYIPQMSKAMRLEQSEQLTGFESGESRLRGGVFAMCGVTVVLLLLLCVCAFLLRRARSNRTYDADYEMPKTL